MLYSQVHCVHFQSHSFSFEIIRFSQAWRPKPISPALERLEAEGLPQAGGQLGLQNVCQKKKKNNRREMKWKNSVHVTFTMSFVLVCYLYIYMKCNIFKIRSRAKIKKVTSHLSLSFSDFQFFPIHPKESHQSLASSYISILIEEKIQKNSLRTSSSSETKDSTPETFIFTLFLFLSLLVSCMASKSICSQDWNWMACPPVFCWDSSTLPLAFWFYSSGNPPRFKSGSLLYSDVLLCLSIHVIFNILQ